MPTEESQTSVDQNTIRQLQREFIFTVPSTACRRLRATVVDDGRAAWGATKDGRFSLGYAYVLLFLGFIGLAGTHRLYLGRTRSFLLYLFTFGLLGVGTVVDFFILWRAVRNSNSALVTLTQSERQSHLHGALDRSDETRLADVGHVAALSPGRAVMSEPPMKAMSPLPPISIPLAMSASITEAA